MIKDYSYDELKNYVTTGKLPDITVENNNNYVPRGGDNITGSDTTVKRTYTPRNRGNNNAF